VLKIIEGIKAREVNGDPRGGGGGGEGGGGVVNAVSKKKDRKRIHF